ncbi:MAG: AAA family ATPase [bacterium]|nr:AAA family ATPase [bacterium]
MEYTKELIGNNLLQHYLQKQVKSGTVHHANLIIGPEHIGKTTLISNLIADLLCTQIEDELSCLARKKRGLCNSCSMLKRDNHPNVNVISPESSGRISISRMRDEISSLNMSGFLPGKRVIVIHQADCMTREASNALLKVLEEPNDNIFFFLLTENSHEILPTIRSRCAHMRMNLVSKEELRKAYDLTDDSTKVIQGLPGLAHKFLDKRKQLAYQEEIIQWILLLTEKIYSKRLVIGRKIWPKTVSREHLINYLSILEDVCRDNLMLQMNVNDSVRYVFATKELQDLQRKTSVDDSMKALELINQYTIKLNQPIQAKILLDQILLKIYR